MSLGFAEYACDLVCHGEQPAGEWQFCARKSRLMAEQMHDADYVSG